MKRTAGALALLLFCILFSATEGNCWGKARCLDYEFVFKSDIVRHTVKNGECLYSIAGKYNVYPWQIVEWNNLLTAKKRWRFVPLPEGKKLEIRIIDWKKTLEVNGLTEGIASCYGRGDGFAGKPTASGRIFRPRQMVAAHPFLPPSENFVLKVTDSASGRSINVLVVDKGPTNRFVRQGRVIDLSWGAMRELSGKGLTPVKVEIIYVFQD